MTAKDIFLYGRQWTRVQVHIYERSPERGDLDKELNAEHADEGQSRLSPVSFETFETRNYVLTYIPSKNRARWNVSFAEDDGDNEA